MAYHRVHGVSVHCINRIFNVYGPRMRGSKDGGVIHRFYFASASKQQAVTIFGNGRQTRSFIYIDDEVEGEFLRLLRLRRLCGAREHRKSA